MILTEMAFFLASLISNAADDCPCHDTFDSLPHRFAFFSDGCSFVRHRSEVCPVKVSVFAGEASEATPEKNLRERCNARTGR